MKSLRKKYESIVESYIDTGDVQGFWHEQQALTNTTTDYEDDLSEYDREFFLEAFEVLYHTDFSTQADEYLHDPSYLMKWMATNYPKYLDKTWEKPFQEGPRWVEIPKAELYRHTKTHKFLTFIFLVTVQIFLLIIVWMAFKALFNFEGTRSATEIVPTFKSL